METTTRDDRAWELLAPAAVPLVIVVVERREPTRPVHMHIGTPDYDHPETCPSCGFDALLTVGLYDCAGIKLGEAKGCGRCYEDERDGRSGDTTAC